MSRDLLPVLVAAIPLFYLSIFLHEMGHAVMAWCMGYQVTSFGIGLGQPWWVVKWRGIRIYFCPRRSTTGLTWALFPKCHFSRWRQIGMIGGGVLANGLATAAALILWWWLPVGQSVWLAALGCNALLCLSSLIPYVVRLGQFQLRTDGLMILELLGSGTIRMTSSEILQTYAALRRHWEAIGDDRMRHAYLLNTAAAWIDLGDAGQAELLLVEADRIPGNRTPLLENVGALVRALVDAGAGRTEWSAAALARAESGFQAAGDETGLFLVRLQRVEEQLERGDAAMARASLEALRRERVLTQHRDLEAILLATELSAAARSGEAEIETLSGRYQRLRLRYPSLERDLRVYRTLAGFFARREEWVRAEPFYEEALTAAHRLHASLPKDEDRVRFQNCQEGLLREAETCLRWVGGDSAVESLPLVFPSPEQLALKRRLDLEQHSRRRHRLGLISALGSFLFGLILFGLSLLWLIRMGADRPDDWALMLAPHVMLICFSLPAILFSLLLPLCWRLWPGLRTRGGTFSLFLGLLPWLGWMTVLVLANLESRPP